jgi:DNA/RNA-binding domain of Phe-tRNA-synthetase-like protein
MAEFRYHPAILERFPEVKGGVLIARNLSNPPDAPLLQELYFKEQQIIKERLGDTQLSQLKSINAWRGAFSRFGVEPTKYRNAAEALLRRLTKKGDIPAINTLVDIGNLISIRYALPVCVIDTRQLEGAVTVCFADGSEKYIPLGQDDHDFPRTGEVIFRDEAGKVLARRWCWRQSEDSSASPLTTEVIVTIESQHPGGQEDVAAAIDDLEKLVVQFTGGQTVARSVLGVDRPGITA